MKVKIAKKLKNSPILSPIMLSKLQVSNKLFQCAKFGSQMLSSFQSDLVISIPITECKILYEKIPSE